MDTYDVVVIGSGPGGYVAAIRASQLGFKTACIEKEKALGGTCLNVGCIPSKALLQSSEHYFFIQSHASEHGIEALKPKLNFKKMQSRKDEVVKGLVQGINGLFKRNKVERIEGTGKLTSPNTVEVNGKTIEAKYILLATGSEPIALPFAPFDEEKIVSSTGALALTKVPKKLLVIGAGVIGLELASVYCRLGSEVTVVEMLDTVCPGFDKSVTKPLHQALADIGIQFYLSAKVTEIKNGKVKVTHSDKTLTFTPDCILVSIGRRPYSVGLGLKEVGVKTDASGFVEVDRHFRTSIPNIYAFGDLIKGAGLAHRASEEGVAIVEALAGKSPEINYIAIPNVVYTHPELASVGFTEEETKEMGIQVIKGIASFKGNPRARASGETAGLVKVIADKATHRLLGVHILGQNASEMIGEAVIALENRSKVEALAHASHAHPTLSEAIKEAALASLGEAVHV
ncbi:MAG: dihydrolipoyl dehydrogenase [Waddliaceae bacterium]